MSATKTKMGISMPKTSLLLLSTSRLRSIHPLIGDMDLPEDTDPPERSALPINLSQYFETPDIGSSSPMHAPWYAAGNDYSFGDLGLFEAPPTSISWTEDDANKFIPGSSTAVQDRDLGLPLSDRSYADVGNPGPSNIYGPALTMTAPDDAGIHLNQDWRPFPPTLSQDHLATDVQPLQLIDPCSIQFLSRRLLDPETGMILQDRSLLATPPPSTTDPASTMLLRPSPLQSRHPIVLAHRDPTSALPFPSPISETRPYIPLSEMTAPYVPEIQTSNLTPFPSSPNTHSTRPLRNNTIRGVRTRRRNTTKIRDQALASAKSAAIIQRGQLPLSCDYSSTSASHSPDYTEPSPPLSTTFPEPDLPGQSLGDPDDGESEADDDDLYQPSRSPSPAFSYSNYSGSLSPPRGSARPRKGKAGKRMSAADALRRAQMSAGSSSVDQDDAAAGPSSSSFQRGSSSSSSTRQRLRRNQTIPIPIPVPHLTKKSRGRKVPHVNAQSFRNAAVGATGTDDDDDDDSDEGGSTARRSSSRRGRGGGPGRAGGGRTFVCSVPGCGKCFVRGEHLKRHVRSIHTHEKPYPCPYPGCGKAFSRQDNLGQHVRLHLNDS